MAGLKYLGCVLLMYVVWMAISMISSEITERKEKREKELYNLGYENGKKAAGYNEKSYNKGFEDGNINGYNMAMAEIRQKEEEKNENRENI